MGGLCSKSATVENAPSSNFSHMNGQNNNGSGLAFECHGLPPKSNSSSATSMIDKMIREPFSFPELSNESACGTSANSYGINLDDINDGIPHLSRALSVNSRSTKSKQATVAKVSEMSSLLGKAGTTGLGKAVDVLDTVASSMTSLHLSGSFVSGITSKGNKISILAFEVANTVVKGANLMQSLSKDNIKHLNEVLLHSEGVQNLISKDVDELLRLAASDKREELKIFCGEVVRFGNRCKDPQWHNLDRYFEKLAAELTPVKQLKEEAETVMLQLMTLVQYTAELYHEMHALDRFEQDYRRRLQEEDNPNTAQRGESLAILRAELKSQRKHVKSLKKKSLWSRILEEVMEKLLDIAHFLHLEIHESFCGPADDNKPLMTTTYNHQILGSAGLALHYANVITQIDTLVSRSNSVPQSTRDALYHGLPPNVKTALRSKLQAFQLKEELTIPQIKAEMEKTLQWLVPIAVNTTKAHHGFGWVGEWANTGSEVGRNGGGQGNLLQIETLHHANKEKAEKYILELAVWLHHLVSLSRGRNDAQSPPVKSPMRSPGQTLKASPLLTVEDREMLREVSKRKVTPGISKSQELLTTRLSKHHRLSKSSSHSPATRLRVVQPSVPVIDFDIDCIKALDVIDRVDSCPGLAFLPPANPTTTSTRERQAMSY
ncbi:hypothetical protein V2J09_004365 [Rumex salicifolius]